MFLPPESLPDTISPPYQYSDDLNSPTQYEKDILKVPAPGTNPYPHIPENRFLRISLSPVLLLPLHTVSPAALCCKAFFPLPEPVRVLLCHLLLLLPVFPAYFPCNPDDKSDYPSQAAVSPPIRTGRPREKCRIFRSTWTIVFFVCKNPLLSPYRKTDRASLNFLIPALKTTFRFYLFL